MCYLLIFVFFIALCFIAGWDVIGWTLIVATVVLLIIMLIVYAQDSDKKKAQIEELKKRNAENAKQKELKKQEYEQWKSELIEKYGQLDKEIVLSENNSDEAILAFSKVSRIWLAGNDLPMNSILSCSLSDSSKTIKGKTTIQSRPILAIWQNELLLVEFY